MDEKAIARFWKYVEKSDGCWLWKGANTGRYGIFWNGEKYEGAHRSSFRIHHGDPTDGFVCHTCDNGFCVRPDHIWLGDVRANTRDMVAKDRSPNASVTNAQAAEMRSRAAAGATIPTLAKAYGMTYSAARDLLLGVRYLDCGVPAVKPRRAPSKVLTTVTEEQIREIRKLRAGGAGITAISKALGLRAWTVSNVVHGKSGRYVA